MSRRIWLVGSGDDCDIRVDQADVSEHHCLLSEADGTFLIEDLNSPGVYVNGERVTGPTSVSASDVIKLGSTAALPWPAQSDRCVRTITIGRSPDNDIVLDFPSVSWEHARIIQDDSGLTVEDLSSTNGTAVHSLLNRIQKSPISLSDSLFFGSYRITGAQLIGKQHGGIGEGPQVTLNISPEAMVIGRDPACDCPLDDPMVSWHHARINRTNGIISLTDLGSRNGTFVNGRRLQAITTLKDGDIVVLGANLLRVSPDGSLHRQDCRGNMTLELKTVAVPPFLSPLSLTVYPSELVGIMGVSGAGKTTLLNALSGYKRAKGSVLINGLDLYSNYVLFRAKIGYVPQEDIIHSQLTVHEALRYTATLRTDLTAREIEEIIVRVTRELEISDCLDKQIGSPERKIISGGQRRRVNIAMELISSPTLLLLDEPTSGLSSEDADNVIQLLKKIAANGSTVILTIHQPSLDIFRQLDGLVVLARSAPGPGTLVYYGPAYPDSLEFFNSDACQRKRSAGQQPGPELLFKGLGGGTARVSADSLQKWVSRYENSPYKQSYVDRRSGNRSVSSQAKEESLLHRVRRGLSHLLPLIGRNFRIKLRDGLQTQLMIAQPPVVAALIVLLLGNLADKAEPFTELAEWNRFVSQIANAHFLMAVAAVWFGCNNAVRDIVGEWAVYCRERMTGLSIPVYLFSKYIVLAGFSALQCVILLGLVNTFCKLQAPFLPTCAILFLGSLVGVAVGLCISSFSRTIAAAIATLPIVLLPFIILGGGIQPIHQREALEQASVTVPTRWAFEADLLLENSRRTSRYEVSNPAAALKITLNDVAAIHFPADQPRVATGVAAAYLAIMAMIWLVVAGVVLKIRDFR